MIRVLIALAIPALALADDAPSGGAIEGRAADKSDLDLRLTLSSFLFRQAGADAPPLLDGGAPIESASPVRRYFGDLRIEMSDGGLAVDGRVRQTTGERYQSGTGGGSEYELRTLSYRIGSPGRGLIVGRQHVEAVGATKIDGAALVLGLGKKWSGTLFGGAFPALGSRSLDTDYPEIVNADGSTGSPLVPVVGGIGAGYRTDDVHGSVGLAAVYVAQDVPGATTTEASRVFATASGYARPRRWLDIYHFALLDVAGNAGVDLTNGSLGANLRPSPAVELALAIHHVSTDVLQIAARNVLEDPDPNAGGLVQNNVAITRVSQDSLRAGTSVALAQSRFEISVSGGFHRRPAVDVALADGGAVRFRDARSVDATMTVLDRKSIAGLRASLSGSLTLPLDRDAPNRSRSVIARLSAGRPFASDRAEVTADLSVARFRTVVDATDCMDSLDPLACYGSSETRAIEAGALGSYRIAREWLFLLDSHVAAHDIEATTLIGRIDYPRVLSFTVFARAQWRYR